jgi:hypothetical protein
VNICVLSDYHSFGKNWYTGTYVLAANVFDGMPLSLLLNVRGRRRRNEVPSSFTFWFQHENTIIIIGF